MLNNKKGISTIVTVIILVALVLVVIGIFWSTAIGVVEKQTENVDLAQKCLGINFKITDVTCDTTTCDVSLERSLGSSGDPVDGISISVSDGTTEATGSTGDISISRTVSITTGITATEASARTFFNDSAGDPQYCASIASWPEA